MNRAPRASSAPPEGWQELLHRQQALAFSKPSWASVLDSSFPGRPLYVHWREGDALVAGILVYVFRKGPFTLAYAGVPYGHLLAEELRVPACAAGLADWARSTRIDRLRVVGPLRDQEGFETWAGRPQTLSVVDLDQWTDHEAWWKNLSRNHRNQLRKAERSPAVLRESREAADFETMHDLYLAAMRRNNGEARYPLAYFRALASLARTEDPPLVRVLLAEIEGRAAAGAAVLADAKVTHYLHAGMDPELEDTYAGYLVTHGALRGAFERGDRYFDMGCSPPGAQGLVRYKSKWGCTERTLTTRTLVLRPLKTWLAETAQRWRRTLTGRRG